MSRGGAMPYLMLCTPDISTSAALHQPLTGVEYDEGGSPCRNAPGCFEGIPHLYSAQAAQSCK